MEEGMRVKVMSWKLDVEEPSAASAISYALSEGPSHEMGEHEWPAINELNGLAIPANGEVAEAVLYKDVAERARRFTSRLTNRVAKFYKVIHYPGTGTLTPFGEQVVASTKNKPSITVYKVACRISIAGPESKIAMIM